MVLEVKNTISETQKLLTINQSVVGILSCGITHTAVVPLDLVKCRIQVDPAKYKSVFHGFKVTLREDGARGLAKGWAPTFFGYSAQGLCKFGLYEVFKVGILLKS